MRAVETIGGYNFTAVVFIDDRGVRVHYNPTQMTWLRLGRKLAHIKPQFRHLQDGRSVFYQVQ